MRANFTDSQVKYIKQLLLAGYAATDIASARRCSPETIGRIKRGESYKHVVVEGEERLRPAKVREERKVLPELEVEERAELPPIPEAPEERPRGRDELNQIVGEDTSAKMLKELEQRLKGTRVAAPAGISEELLAQARQMAGGRLVSDPPEPFGLGHAAEVLMGRAQAQDRRREDLEEMDGQEMWERPDGTIYPLWKEA